MKLYNIHWDTDGGTVELPTKMIIPDDTDTDKIADLLSDIHGWCVLSFEIDIPY